MMKLNGKLVGVEGIQMQMLGLGEAIRDRLRKVVQESAAAMVGAARSNVHSRSGHLAGSVRATMDEVPWKRISARVGTDVHYGRFLESGFTPNPRKTAGWMRNPRKAKDWRKYDKVFGGRRIVAHPWLRPAAATLSNSIRSRLNAAVRGG